MYVRHGARLRHLVRRDLKALVAVLLLAFLIEALEPLIPDADLFSVGYVAVFSTALSIFLVFRFNEAYERWWEARKIWGRITNLCRDSARQVLTLLGSAAEDSEKKRLVYRLIAFPHALRIRLREGESPAGRRELESRLRRLLPDEADRLLARQNVPTALIQTQSEQLKTLLPESTADRIVLTRLDETLSGLLDAQGGCERIKNTAFPDMVSLITRLLVWALVVLLNVASLGSRSWTDAATTVAVAMMAMGYIWIDSMGRDLNDPFENAPNDTPMSSISTNVERDLREMLDETELPEPVRAVRGVLM